LVKAMLKELADGTSDPDHRHRAVEVLRFRFWVSQRRACRMVGQHRSTQRLPGRMIQRSWPGRLTAGSAARGHHGM